MERETGDHQAWVAEILARSEHRAVTLTTGGQAFAVVLDPEQWWSIRETLDILTTPGSAAALDQGIAELDAGEDTDGPEFLEHFRRSRT